MRARLVQCGCPGDLAFTLIYTVSQDVRHTLPAWYVCIHVMRVRATRRRTRQLHTHDGGAAPAGEVYRGAAARGACRSTKTQREHTGLARRRTAATSPGGLMHRPPLTTTTKVHVGTGKTQHPSILLSKTTPLVIPRPHPLASAEGEGGRKPRA